MGISSVEDVDCLEPVDILGVVPIRDIIARPLDEVLEFSVSDLAIEYLFHLPFLFSVDFHRRGRWYDLAGVCFVRRWFQFGDVSHGVHLDVGGEVHPVGVGGLNVRVFHDFEAGFALVVKLPGWSRRTWVLGEEPYQIPKAEVWHRRSLLVGLVLVTLLDINHAGPCRLVDFDHS